MQLLPAAALYFAIRARMSSTCQQAVFLPSLVGLGNLPSLIPFHHDDLQMPKTRKTDGFMALVAALIVSEILDSYESYGAGVPEVYTY